MIERFLTTEQVAGILQVHPFTILKFIKQGKLPGVKLGRVYRIKESDVMQFLEERTTGGRKSPRQEVEIKREEPHVDTAKEGNDDGAHYYII